MTREQQEWYDAAKDTKPLLNIDMSVPEFCFECVCFHKRQEAIIDAILASSSISSSQQHELMTMSALVFGQRVALEEVMRFHRQKAMAYGVAE